MKMTVVRLHPLAFFAVLLSLVSCQSLSNAQKKNSNISRTSTTYKGFGKKKTSEDDVPNPAAFVSTADAAATKWERDNLEPYGLELFSGGSGGARGVRAQKDRPAGEILLEIPLGETLTANRIRSRLVASCARTDNEKDNDNDNDNKIDDNEEDALALGLLRLRDEAEDPYIATVMPRVQSNVWTLPEDLWKEVSTILPRCYAETFRATRQRVQGFAAKAADTRVARNDALWAFSMVRSRSFAAPELAGERDNSDAATSADPMPPLALLPGLDLLNHAFGSRVQLQLVVDEDDDNGSTNSRWVVTSLDPIREGEELLWSYGDDKDNWKLLLTYGFALPDNPNAVVFWTWEDLLEAAHVVRPDTFSDPVVKQLLRHPQLRAYTVSSEDRATFSYDARTQAPRESLQTGLSMLSNLAAQLGKPEPEDGLLERQVLETLVQRRLEELSDGLNRLQEHRTRAKDKSGSEWNPFFDSLQVALESERRQLEKHA